VGIAGDKSQPSWGQADYWLIKVDALGQKQWERSYGGDREDKLQVVQQTADGGYILEGTSDSGVSGDKTVPPQPGVTWLVPSDSWLLKLDASGAKE
jgi:hypothetical protein